MPYHMQPMPTPRRFGPPAALKAAIVVAARLRQCGRSASRHAARPTDWRRAPGRSRCVSPARSALRRRNSSRSMPSLSASSSISASWAIAACGTPKPRKAPDGGALVKIGARPGAHVGHAVRAHGMHRHAVGDRRAPRGVGAGVEVAVELAGEQPALGVAAEPGARSAPDGAWSWPPCSPAACRPGHRPAELPRRDRQQRLHREVELAAEAAAAGRRHDAHGLGPQPHDDRDLVAVHVGRLGGDMDLDAVADPLGPAGLGLDIGVLDEGGLEHALGHRGAGAKASAASPRLTPPSTGGCRGLSACTRGASAAIAASMPTTGGSRRPGDRHVSSRIASTTVALADQRDDRLAAIAHLAVGQHRLVLDVGIDAEAVRPARRPPSAPRPRAPRAAASRSPSAKRARACGERTTRIHSASAGTPSAPNRSRPVDLGRAVDPRQARADGRAGRRRGGQRGRRIQDGLDDLAVAGAAAEHAAERILDLAARRPRRLAPGARWAAISMPGVQMPHCAAPWARNDACSAASVPCRRQALDGLDRAARDLAHRHQAGADLPAVEQHGAGAAVAGVAADLGAGEAEVVAQRREPGA